MHDQPEADFVSKSQRKRDADVLFDLGRSLCKLSDAQLRKIELPEPIRYAVDKARRIKAHVAHKRELQYLAKLLRQIDTSAIADGVAQVLAPGHDETRRLHRIEAWRDRLLTEGDAALTQLMGSHQTVDAQQIRNLLRQANRQAQRQAPAAAARQLFKILRTLDAESPLPE
jgi:ribosome-associated protein